MMKQALELWMDARDVRARPGCSTRRSARARRHPARPRQRRAGGRPAARRSPAGDRAYAGRRPGRRPAACPGAKVDVHVYFHVRDRPPCRTGSARAVAGDPGRGATALGNKRGAHRPDAHDRRRLPAHRTRGSRATTSASRFRVHTVRWTGRPTARSASASRWVDKTARSTSRARPTSDPTRPSWRTTPVQSTCLALSSRPGEDAGYPPGERPSVDRSQVGRSDDHQPASFFSTRSGARRPRPVGSTSR